MKKAVVIGSTGMVGTQLIQLLLLSNDYSEIISLVRRKSGVEHPKLKEYSINFDKPDEWKDLVIGDVLFSTLGTTISAAKSKEAQFKVDYTYQYNVAEIASQNAVSTYVLVSSAGANPKSLAFYASMKGKLEDAVKLLPFKVITILRPGQLAGNRLEKRTAEKIGLQIMSWLNKIGLLRKYKPIHSRQVAQAMIKVAQNSNSTIYSLDEIFKIIE